MWAFVVVVVVEAEEVRVVEAEDVVAKERDVAAAAAVLRGLLIQRLLPDAWPGKKKKRKREFPYWKFQTFYATRVCYTLHTYLCHVV